MVLARDSKHTPTQRIAWLRTVLTETADALRDGARRRGFTSDGLSRESCFELETRLRRILKRDDRL